MDDRAAGRIEPETVATFAWLFMATDTGRPIVPALHHWLWLRLWADESIRRLIIIAPPESAKTTWLMAYVATQIAFFPERPRIYAGATGAVATRRTWALRTLLTSRPVLDVFPELQRAEGMSWEKHQWSLAPHGVPHAGRIHPTMSAYGTDGPITGSRAREAVGDDILDEANTRTAYQRDKVEKWIHDSFLSRVIARTGRALLIGTAWHHSDVYHRLKETGGWVWCHIPMLAESDHVYATIEYPAGWEGETLGRPVAEEARAEAPII